MQVYFGDHMKLIGEFGLNSRNMRFSPDSTMLVVVNNNFEFFYIISLTPDKASGEE